MPPSSSSSSSSLRAVTAWALCSRVLMVFWCVLADWALPDHAASGVRVFELDVDGVLPLALLRPFTRWDAAHFLTVADTGYAHELDAVWFPALPLAIRCCASPLRLLLGRRESLVVAGVLISNTAFVLAARSLYAALNRLYGEQPARAAGLAFALTPAGVFFSTAYSESLFSYFAMTGICYAATGRLVWSSLHLAMASLTRSNGAMLALVIAVPALHHRRISRRTLSAAIACGVVAAPPVVLDALSYFRRCHAHVRPEWCDSRWPSLYRHAQSANWDVGFFRYWRLKQLPNFLLAAPALYLGARAATRQNDAPLCRSLRVHAGLTVAVVLLVAHVEIGTRLLAASNPLLYLELAEITRSRPKMAAAYLVAFNVLGAAAHANFLPWT